MSVIPMCVSVRLAVTNKKELAGIVPSIKIVLLGRLSYTLKERSNMTIGNLSNKANPPLLSVLRRPPFVVL